VSGAPPGLPPGFDYVDLGMLLTLIEELAGFLRAGSMDAAPGENEIWERAHELVEHYRPAT
jgi:hypothetical protein